MNMKITKAKELLRENKKSIAEISDILGISVDEIARRRNSYKKKFKMNLLEFVNKESKKLQGYYRIKNNFDSFFAIALYKRIEKRGFRVIIDDRFHKEIKEDEVYFIASLI